MIQKSPDAKMRESVNKSLSEILEALARPIKTVELDEAQPTIRDISNESFALSTNWKFNRTESAQLVELTI